jgi:hypothetical protein
MDIEAQNLIEELLEINKQQTLQIAMLKAMIKAIQANQSQAPLEEELPQ